MATALFAPGSPDVLYLVDLSSYVLRAYHAIAPLSSPSGEPTHAVHGTVTMLDRLFRERRPALVGVAMDSGRVTFRSEIYPAYKANRPPAPDDLKQQMLEIVASHDSLTVRHLFYLMVSAGLVEKTEACYNNVVIRLALQLRRSGDIPYGKIMDGTRLYRQPRLYDSVQEALNETARLYRRSYWTEADVQVEVHHGGQPLYPFLFGVE